MTTALAPGKVILWGEYVVLTGAPAAVLAVDRYASCRIDVGGGGATRWRLETRGFASTPMSASLAQLAQQEGVVGHVLRAMPPESLARVDEGGSVILDTTTFHRRGHKLGIGSSAAITTAAYLAFASLLGTQATFEQALAIHSNFQGKSGSGADVAAAWYGGTLRFEAGEAQPLKDWYPHQWAFFWTGRPANTSGHIEKFRRFVDVARGNEVAHLQTSARALFAQPGDRLAQVMGEYVDALRRLDHAAALGIYSPAHESLHALAQAQGVVYKPCGAGGGDLGAVISDNPEKLAAFTAAAIDLGFDKLEIGRADHGVQISH